MSLLHFIRYLCYSYHYLQLLLSVQKVVYLEGTLEGTHDLRQRIESELSIINVSFTARVLCLFLFGDLYRSLTLIS